LFDPVFMATYGGHYGAAYARENCRASSEFA